MSVAPNPSQPPQQPEPRPATKRIAEAAWAVFGVLFVWFLLMAFIQGGWPATWRGFVAVMIIASLAGMLSGMGQLWKRRPVEVVAAVMIFASLAWTYLAGTFKSWSQMLWDAAGIAIGMGIASIVAGTLRRRRPFSTAVPDTLEGRLRSDLGIIGYLLAAWVGVSVVTLLRPSQLPSDPQRFSTIDPSGSIAAQDAAVLRDLRIGVALSGGGYRAAVFHSGALHALERLGVRANHLSTVSGGSIIGSYYAIGGDPVAFKDAVAEGRFNLKRELLLIQNATRLAFPMRVPGTQVELFPWYGFSRRDVQAGMLDRLLLDGRQHTNPLDPSAPALIVNATDLTFGLLVGFLPDGIIVQGPDRDIGVYRGTRYSPTLSLSLADRVSISGAFPLAFPATQLGARVNPVGATGQGTRPLQLVDGGVIDNTGRASLMNASVMACRETNCDRTMETDSNFVTDLLLVSDGGAIFGVDGEYEGAAQLSRAVDVGGAQSGSRFGQMRDMPTLQFSAQSAYLSPDTQFRLYSDPDADRPKEPGKEWHVRFDPRDGYPDPVVDAIVDLLPAATHPKVRSAWSAYRAARDTGPAPDPRAWSKWLPRAVKLENCDAARSRGPSANELRQLPGICDAAEMRRAFTAELRVLLEAFRATSTLDDQLGPERTDQLFRLGQLLVYRDWPELRNAAVRSHCFKSVRAECDASADETAECRDSIELCRSAPLPRGSTGLPAELPSR